MRGTYTHTHTHTHTHIHTHTHHTHQICLYQFTLIHCYSLEIQVFIQIKTEIPKASIHILYSDKHKNDFLD
jgi:hypothetical protein